LEVDFTYPILHKGSYGRLAYPEIQLMCIIVVATKLSQPFDVIVRHPESESDPTTLKIDWLKWREIMTEKESDELKRGEEIKITDASVISMSERKMDDYLDWYQRTWTDDRDSKSTY
jgi:RNA polymerase I-specific transcription initiation factor RRN7